MQYPELPENEEERIRQLRRYEILDSLPESIYDDLTVLAASICNMPIALMTLIDEERQWFKSRFGTSKVSETPRSISFCAHTINAPDTILEVKNTDQDPRFEGNPATQGKNSIKYYAGAPIVDNMGFALGTICVIDHEPRELTNEQKTSLKALARQAASHLELRKELLSKKKADENYIRLLDNVDDAIYELDHTGRYVFANFKTRELLGVSKEELKEYHAFSFVHPSDLPDVKTYHYELLQKKETNGYYEMRIVPKSRIPVWVGQKITVEYENGVVKKIRAIARDLSVVKKLREELRHRESQYKVLSDNSRDVIAVHDKEGTYKYISQSVKEVVGYNPNEILDKMPYQFMHNDDVENVVKALQQMRETGELVTSFECRIRKKDQSFLWVEINAKVIKDLDGAVSGFHTSARDISERKKNANNLSLLIENTTDAVWAIDRSYQFIYFNSVFETFYKNRVGTEPTIGGLLNWKKLLPLGADRNDYNFLEKGLEGLKNTEEAKFTIKKSLVVFDNSASPILDEKGDVIGVSVLSRDVTKGYQEKLRSHKYQVGLRLLNDLGSKSIPIEDLFSEALNVICGYFDMPAGIISQIENDNYVVKHVSEGASNTGLTVGSSYDYKQTYCQFAFENLTVLLIEKASNSAYAGHPCFKTKEVKSYLGAAIRVGSHTYGTINFTSFENRKEPFSEYDGEFMQLFANWIGSVIAKEEVYQSLQLEKEKAEQATIAKANFLSMMSHEVRTPLNGIIGTTHLLLGKHPTPDQAKHLNILKKSSDHLQAIVSDILDFAKIEEGKILLEDSEFDLNELLEGIITNYQVQSEEKSLAMHLDYGTELGLYYWGDQVRLNQVLHNLMNNAIKFTEKGSITINCKRINQVNNYDHIQIAVNDTGIGISKENLPNIFGVFSQANESITRKFGGSGLGLSITKKLLELMGSEIEVESIENKGTTFRFNIVLKKGVERQSTNKEKEDPTINQLNGNVLIVEDNVFNRVIARDFVESWGLQAQEAENGEIAIGILKEKDVDIVLLDIQMPVMDGYETIEWIRSQNEDYFQELPVLALTASAMVEVQHKVYASGMNDFLTKPFVPEEFHNKVEEHLNRRKAISGNLSFDYLGKILNNDLDKMERFYQLFVESVTKDYEFYHAAIEQGNPDKLLSVVRKNKSNFKSLGLHELATQAFAIERMIAKGNPLKMILFEAEKHLVDIQATVKKIKTLRSETQ